MEILLQLWFFKKIENIFVKNRQNNFHNIDPRLAALNEEIRASDLTGGDDDTFNDVVQEFSQVTF
jgi:hypothetical protein